MATLRTEGLTKSYGGRTVVRDVDLDVSSGEVVGLLGPNGAGKTTTFGMVVGLDGPRRAGACCSTTKTSPRDPMYVRARKGIGYLPQEAVDLPRADGRAEHPGDSRDAADLDGATRARAAARAAGGAQPDAARAQQGATRCRAASAGASRSRARSVNSAEVHAARRAVCRHRSHRRQRDSEDHLPPEGARHRRPRHRPQRPRDAQDHRSGLYRARWRDLPQRNTRVAWPPTTMSSGFTSERISGWTKIEAAATQV